MSQFLKDIPDNVVCFVDATIFYYHLVNTPPLSGDCSDVALAEATHKVMLAEIVQRHGVVPLCKPTRT